MKSLLVFSLSLFSLSSMAGVHVCACEVYQLKTIGNKTELVASTKVMKRYRYWGENPMLTPAEDCVQYRAKSSFPKSVHGKVASCSLLNLSQEEVELLNIK